MPHLTSDSTQFACEPPPLHSSSSTGEPLPSPNSSPTCIAPPPLTPSSSSSSISEGEHQLRRLCFEGRSSPRDCLRLHPNLVPDSCRTSASTSGVNVNREKQLQRNLGRFMAVVRLEEGIDGI
ncbi:unnamed protein product [Linum trigynum]|uniref:Uncharacterized protein n=1 Tax=Linum trigynum TaxID=586398 RepID=A0AAV2GS70_9ROSI